jgi:hypothetical protein
METVSIFAIGSLILALAAGVAGAVVGSYQFVLGGAIVVIISAITIFIVVAIETRGLPLWGGQHRRQACL